MPKHFPISAAKALAKSQGCSQIIIAAWDGERTHIVTYGDTVEACDQAAQGGDKIKAALGWTDVPMVLPSRVKQLLDALKWIALFATVRSKDDRKTFARVQRQALAAIADRADAAIARATNTEPQPDKVAK